MIGIVAIRVAATAPRDIRSPAPVTSWSTDSSISPRMMA